MPTDKILPSVKPAVVVAKVGPMLKEFLQQESAGGILLIIAALLALLVANSPLEAAYSAMLDLPVIAGAGSVVIAKPLILWINDGLMAVFFFLIGLEVKREVLTGQLSSWDKASLPLVAAIGGMAAPALIYMALNSSDPVGMRGWAIPAATDIAFALGVLMLLGPRVPAALKALLLAIAVIDDIGAIAIIAAFYTAETNLQMLAGGGVTLALLALTGRARIASSIPYVLLTLVLWVFVLKSGVHATLAGVAAAMCVPLSARNGETPLERMEHGLHPWVAFIIIPIFGFANAGVTLQGLTPGDFLAPVPLGIALGLLLGKQLGIFGLSWLAVKSGLARLPEGIGWRQVHAVSLLAAIGFTMSLFIGNLAFTEPARIEAVKLGVLMASAIAAFGGYALLRLSLTRDMPDVDEVE